MRGWGAHIINLLEPLPPNNYLYIHASVCFNVNSDEGCYQTNNLEDKIIFHGPNKKNPEKQFTER